MQTTVKAVGTAAVLVMALVVLYAIARLKLEPWWVTLVLAAPPSALILAGCAWMFSGGEQGTQLEWNDGERRLSIKNLNLFARALAQSALTAFSRAPLPHPVGTIGPGGPNDPKSLIEGPADLPPEVDITDEPPALPPDAGRLS